MAKEKSTFVVKDGWASVSTGDLFTAWRAEQASSAGQEVIKLHKVIQQLRNTMRYLLEEYVCDEFGVFPSDCVVDDALYLAVVPATSVADEIAMDTPDGA